jgi:hypothetical protein
MYRLFLSLFLFSVIFLFSAPSYAQMSDDPAVIHVQTWKMTSVPNPDEETAFAEAVQRRADAAGSDPRVLGFRAVRHNWGADSRDFVIITEFKNKGDLFSFHKDLDEILEKTFSKEQLDKDNALWDKYVAYHSDEIYRVIASKK